MREEYFRWHSPNLSLPVEMLVYGHAGYPVVVFPTSMGRYYESRDFQLVESARWFVENGLIQLFCPDSADRHSWYNKAVHPARRVANHIWYDNMVLDEIVHRVRHRSHRSKVAVAGASFGGYHAANFAFRHPEYVSHLFSMSGAFDIKPFMDGHYDDNVYFNNPVDYLPDMQHPDLWRMHIVLGTSDQDICKDANLHLSYLLHRKGVQHWLDMRHNAPHDWPVWREMFPHYLSLL